MSFHQRDSRAFASGATGAANTVQVGIAAAGHVEVEHVAYVRNINPACRDVSSDQHIYAAIGEAFDTFNTLSLRHFTFQVAVRNARQAQHFRQFVHALTLTNEDD